MFQIIHSNRRIFHMTGQDVYSFMQGLITNDINKLKDSYILYTLMLTPAGRFNFEFFLYKQDDESLYLDIAGEFAESLIKKLKLLIFRWKNPACSPSRNGTATPWFW